MKAAETMVKQGLWLFRYRSYLPLIFLVLAMVAMWTQRELYITEYIWLDVICLLLACFGEFIRVMAVGYAADRTSGRNVKRQVADEINQTGIYSLVRHPLYIGNFFIWLAVALFSRVWWLVVDFIFIYWIYYQLIILAEESFLSEKFGEAYRIYADKVPCIFPKFTGYLPNKYSFRYKKVLRQENSTLYGMILVFLAVEILQEYISCGTVRPAWYWIAIGIAFTMLYLIMRSLKKMTRILHNDEQQEKTTPEE
jgi:protein-S-isoprenylcysteine O-methyltransferase Ste14